MTLDVFSITGQYAMTSRDGELLLAQLREPILSDVPVELDFLGVRMFASPYFNNAIGPLLKDMTAAELRDRLTITNISPVGQDIITRVIENSEQYYRHPETRRALDSILTSGEEASDGGEDGSGNDH